jgi:L-methionine (R)-S-oxide reductase
LDKEEKYIGLINQARALIDHDVDDIANMANVTRLLYDAFEHHWIGFYRVIEDRMLLGPFCGPIACTEIPYGKGVCGTSWETKQTKVVDNVHLFPGHIACSPLSNSEIVVPCIRENKVYAVLDIDSTNFGEFNAIDQKYLEVLVNMI